MARPSAITIVDDDDGVDREDTATTAATSSPSKSARSQSSPSKSARSSIIGDFTETMTRNLTDLLDTMGTEERKKERRRSSMRGSGRQDALKSGGTLLEKSLGTLGDGFLSARANTMNSLETNRTLGSLGTDEVKRLVKERRGIAEKPPTLFEVIDHGAEEVVQNNVEVPWFLASCMDKPFCQRLCHPAEYATRGRREEKDQKGHDGDDKAEKMLGLPEWEKAGFCLEGHAESHWADERIPVRLGLHFAVHKKTSVERLVLVLPKAKLPAGVSKEQHLSVIRNLKRCDHVNVLRCHEVCEDEEHLYFVYDNFPSVTLLSVMEVQEWTQEQLVNIVRECCAAVAFASSVGLYHLGWTLCHVLLPITCLTGDPMPAKVFGFGMMGTFNFDSSDRMCWAPEAIEAWQKNGESFLQKIEPSIKGTCDLWSLGTIVYSLISRRPPFLGHPQVMTDAIVSRKWAFSLAFDEVDPEAKGLVEGLLEGNHEKRMKPEVTLHNEWIRRRWKPPPHGPSRNHVFNDLEDFCSAPLAKRLFGRFLVKFLDAEHMRLIAHAFYALDTQGDGVLCSRDLTSCAKSCGRPSHATKVIIEWMCRDVAAAAPSISLTRFAECMAEDVIDGKALRHAFESLDDDGSEQISAEELFDELRVMDDNLTLDQILEHIAAAEAELEDHIKKDGEEETTKDHQIDFEEFVHLFPVRLKKLKHLQHRTEANLKHAQDKQKEFLSVKSAAEDWIQDMKFERQKLDHLSNTAANKDESESAVKDMKKHMSRINEYLRHPPGPADAKTMAMMMQGKSKKKHKSKRDNTNAELFGYNSFIQDQAVREFWGSLVVEEIRMIRQAIVKDPRTGQIDHIDHFKAHDAAETAMSKISDILDWVSAQLEEYNAFIEVMTDTESLMPGITLSSRGLQQHGDDDGEGDEENDNGDADDKHGSLFSRCMAKLKGD